MEPCQLIEMGRRPDLPWRSEQTRSSESQQVDSSRWQAAVRGSRPSAHTLPPVIKWCAAAGAHIKKPNHPPNDDGGTIHLLIQTQFESR